MKLQKGEPVMRILLAGGGSGGHVTPLRAIYDELRVLSTDPIKVEVVTNKGFYSQTQSVFSDCPGVHLRKISSGKYRRYKSKSIAWHITHLPTALKNVRDIFLLVLGTVQALAHFLVQRPNVVFCKGGFVCVPVGVAARIFKVPLIIHDSDTIPGLTNRILSRWAAIIATGMPALFYPYPKKKMIYTGIPVDTLYKPTTEALQDEYKESLKLPSKKPMLLVTGGGNGATSLNALVAAAAPSLLAEGWSIVHLTGKGKAADVLQVRSRLAKALRDDWLIEEFAAMPPRLLGADIVLCRTSATTIQECANARKTVIGIASPNLSDQRMNAEYFASENALISLEQAALAADGSDILEAVNVLKSEPARALRLAKTLHKKFAKPRAACELAKVILEAAASS